MGKGKKATCFSDKEEGMFGLTEKVPFLLEAKLKELGAELDIADPWSDKAVCDGKLVTGQNPRAPSRAPSSPSKPLASSGDMLCFFPCALGSVACFPCALVR